MDTSNGRILTFLKDNSNLDLEVPDIAFSLKKSEKTVESSLKKMQQKGLVTARQNEYGRIYWYVLPSAPVTKTYKVDEIKAVKEIGMSGKNGNDDEVDLSELHKNNISPTIPEENENTSTMSVSHSRVPRKRNSKIPSMNDTHPSEYKKEQVVSFEPKIPADNNNLKKNQQSEGVTDSVVENMSTTAGEQADVKITYSSLLVPAFIILGLMSAGALLRSCDSDTKIRVIEATIPKDVVTAKQLNDVKNETDKIAALEKKVSTLSSEIDSLKKLTASIQIESKKEKKPFFKKRYSSRKK